MSRGVGRLITTGAGCGMGGRGHGGRDRCGAEGITVRSGRRRMCRSMDGAGVLDFGLDGAGGAGLDGCRSGLVTTITPGGADIAAATVWSSRMVGSITTV